MFFSNLLGGNEALVSEGGGGAWRGGGGSGRTAAGVTVTPETALAITVLQTCVTLLAESVGQLPLELYRRLGDGKRESAIAHPLYDVLRYQPNPWQTPYEYRESGQLSLGLRGNCYSFIDRNDDGSVKGLYPLRNDKVTVLKGGDLRPVYRVGGHEPLPMRLIHHVRWHTKNHYIGMSPVELHADAVGLAHAVRQYAGKSFANGTAVSGVIERPREAPPIKEQGSIDRILDQWGNKFSGIDNAKKVAMLQEGMIEVKTLTLKVDATDAVEFATKAFSVSASERFSVETKAFSVAASEAASFDTPTIQATGEIVSDGDQIAGDVSQINHPHDGVAQGLQQSGKPLPQGAE